MSIDDPAVVREEYASEAGLAGRASVYRWADGPDAREMAFAAVVETCPRRVLEVGCGRGEHAERIALELGAEVVALDQSERMVELTRRRGVDVRLGDVQDLPFEDGEFDCALAAWMLYHVAGVDRALGELARVLRPGGRLVAVTNGREHLRELRELLGVPKPPSTFDAENGAALLRRHFSAVERRDATGSITFPDRAAAQGYVEAARTPYGTDADLPEFHGPLRVRTAPYVFVAET